MSSWDEPDDGGWDDGCKPSWEHDDWGDSWDDDHKDDEEDDAWGSWGKGDMPPPPPPQHEPPPQQHARSKGKGKKASWPIGAARPQRNSPYGGKEGKHSKGKGKPQSGGKHGKGKGKHGDSGKGKHGDSGKGSDKFSGDFTVTGYVDTPDGNNIPIINVPGFGPAMLGGPGADAALISAMLGGTGAAQAKAPSAASGSFSKKPMPQITWSPPDPGSGSSPATPQQRPLSMPVNTDAAALPSDAADALGPLGKSGTDPENMCAMPAEDRPYWLIHKYNPQWKQCFLHCGLCNRAWVKGHWTTDAHKVKAADPTANANASEAECLAWDQEELAKERDAKAAAAAGADATEPDAGSDGNKVDADLALVLSDSITDLYGRFSSIDQYLRNLSTWLTDGEASGDRPGPGEYHP